jgi:hypothetical protein
MARTTGWKDHALRQLKRGRPRVVEERLHQMTNGCGSFSSPAIEGAWSRIPSGGEFLWLAPGG